MLLLVAGRKARPGSRRIPQTQTSGAARIFSTHLHEGSSVRTHSAFNRGVTPLQRSSPCRYCASALGSVVFQSHRTPIESSGLASRPAQLHSRLNPYPQLTAPLRHSFDPDLNQHDSKCCHLRLPEPWLSLVSLGHMLCANRMSPRKQHLVLSYLAVAHSAAVLALLAARPWPVPLLWFDPIWMGLATLWFFWLIVLASA